MGQILIELLKALGWFFINPLFYLFFILIYISSTRRVQQERRTFGYKVFPTLDEWYGLKRIGLIISVLLSAFFVLIGVFLPPIVFVGLILFTFLYAVTGKFSGLNGAYLFGSVALLILLDPFYRHALPDFLIHTYTLTDWVILTALIGVFILVESFLLTRIKNDQTFPERFVGPRGKMVGQHRIKKLMLLPLLFIWPIGDLTLFFEWWPVIDFQGERYGFILFPLLLGLEHVVSAHQPVVFSKILRKKLVRLGQVVLLLSLLGLWFPPFILLSIPVAIIGRKLIIYLIHKKEEVSRPLFYPAQKGLKVLGVHPFSPASEMGILVGEVIYKVNGHLVKSEDEFYHALQSNLAFCKLEILNIEDEIRFVSRPYYDGDHFQLGLVFVLG